MKNVVDNARRHGKNLSMHLKKHHKKYLLGAFGGFAIVKTIILFLGLLPMLNIKNIFAYENEPKELNSTTLGDLCIITNVEDDKIKIDCYGTGITSVAYGTFLELEDKNINELNLSNNNIVFIETGAFTGLNIDTLNLNYNKLSTFDLSVLKGISSIQRLFLQNNEIFDVSNSYMIDFNLSSLKLDNNCLGDIFDNLYNILNLHETNISYENQQACFYVEYSPDTWTNEDVEATIILIGNEGIVNHLYESFDNGRSKTFSDNIYQPFNVDSLFNKSGLINNYPEDSLFPAYVNWIDRKGPICGTDWTYSTGNTSNWINTDVTAYLTGSTDEDSGIYEAGLSCTIHNGQGSTCSIKIVDNAKNAVECVSNRSYNIDTSRPTVIFNNNSGSASTGHSVIITISDNLAGFTANQELKYKWTKTECSTNGYSGLQLPSGTTISGTVDTDGLNDGAYYLCVLEGSVFDKAGNGNLGLKSEGRFIVDNTKPNCIWQAPTKTGLIVGETGSITLKCTDTLAGIATNSLNPGDIEYDDSVIGLEAASTGDITNGISYVFVYTAIASGNTSLVIKTGSVQDNAGNTNNSAISQNITVSGPEHPSPGYFVSFIIDIIDGWARQDNVKIGWHQGATGGYDYFDDNDTTTKDWTSINYKSPDGNPFELTFNEETKNGKYVCAFGETGGYDPQTICTQFPIQIDATNPDVTLIYPEDNRGFSTGTSLDLLWSGSDEYSGISGYILNVTKPSGSTTPYDIGNTTGKTITLNETGAWHRSVIAYDNVGNSGFANGSFNVFGSNEPIITGKLIEFSIDVAPNWMQEDTVEIKLYKGATGGYMYFNDNNTGNVDRSGGSHPIPSSGFIELTADKNGEYICAFGETGGVTQTICSENPIRIDTARPSISLVYPYDGANFQRGSDIVLRWSGNDQQSGISGYTLDIIDPSGSGNSYNFGANNTEKAIYLSKTGTWYRTVVAYDNTYYTSRSITGYFYVSLTGGTPEDGFFLISPTLGAQINLGNNVELSRHSESANSGYDRQIRNISGAIIASGTTTGFNVTVNSGYFTTGAYSRSVKNNNMDITKSIPLFYIVDGSNIPDLKVDQFEFDEIEDADIDEYYSSNEITIDGLSNNRYSYAYLGNGIGALFINGHFVGTSGFVKNGDEVYIEMKASEEYNETVKTTLFIGGGVNTVSGDFKITTQDGIHNRDNPSLTPLQRMWGIIFVDNLVEMYQYDEEKLATFLSTFMQLLQDKSDYYASLIQEAEDDGDEELAEEYKLYKEAIDFLYITVKYRYDNLDVEDRTVYIAPNGKQYLVEYDEDRMAYTSPDFVRAKYFPTWELFTKHIDSNNPKAGSRGIQGNVITTHNGKIYTIYETNGKWTSKNFATAKYFDTKEDIINHILANNPASNWNHKIDTDFDEVSYTAPNGRVYKIFKTSSKGNNPNMYSSYDFINAKYFTTLEAAKKFIKENNPK